MKTTRKSDPSKTKSGVPAKETAGDAPGKKVAQSRASEAKGMLLLAEFHKVAIECFQPEACEVYLAMTFNNWQPDATPLRKLKDGRWVTQLALTAGRHEYRFVIDGESRDDPMAERSVLNFFGGSNSVLEVGGMA